MKTVDRLHRSPAARERLLATHDRPPILLKSLGRGARVRLFCGACAWSKSYDPYRLIARLQEKGAGGPTTPIAHVARHVHWPCPACRRMAWATQPEWPGR